MLKSAYLTFRLFIHFPDDKNTNYEWHLRQRANTYISLSGGLPLINISDSMEQHISKFGIDYRGRHWKGTTIKNATSQKTYVLNNKNEILNTAQWLKQLNIFITTFLNKCSVYLLRVVIYELILVLQKDVPTHYWIKI